jgi:hypothetical protein
MTERVKSGLTWRGLETGYGEASEAPSNERDGQQIGFTYGIPRQSSTLPSMGRFYYKATSWPARCASSIPAHSII